MKAKEVVLRFSCIYSIYFDFSYQWMCEREWVEGGERKREKEISSFEVWNSASAKLCWDLRKFRRFSSSFNFSMYCHSFGHSFQISKTLRWNSFLLRDIQINGKLDFILFCFVEESSYNSWSLFSAKMSNGGKYIFVYDKNYAQNVTTNFQTFLENDLYIDLIFVCRNNKRVGAHQVVLGCLSKFFYSVSYSPCWYRNN